MHELSLTHDLVEIASDAARQANVQRVDVVHLKVGALAGVVTDSLLFCYDLATRGTPLEGSRLEIHPVPLVVKCERCPAKQQGNGDRSKTLSAPRCGILCNIARTQFGLVRIGTVQNLGSGIGRKRHGPRCLRH